MNEKFQNSLSHIAIPELSNSIIIGVCLFLCLPCSVMVVEGEVFGGDASHQQQLEATTIILPLYSLRSRLAHVPSHKYYPLITQR